MRAPVNYCQVCGTEMIDREAFGQIRRACPACDYIHFNDPKVAAVVFVEQDGRVLLVRRAMDPERGKWGLPAGFIDDGEDPVEAAAREVYEETSLRVRITGLTDVRGDASGIGASIIIMYTAEVLGGVAQARDDADAIWWYVAGDPLPELAFESTHRMLADWLARHSGGHR